MSDIQTPPDGTEVELEEGQAAPEQAPADETPAEVIPEGEEPQPEEPETPTGDEPVAPPAPANPADPDYQEKFRQSSSEAMILNSKLKNTESTLNKLTSEDTPTEAEILAEYPDYKGLNSVSQKIVRETITNKKRQLRIDRQFVEQDADRKWQTELKTLIRKPEYASLKGDDKFEEFVFQPKHQGVDIQVLADAYLVRTGRAQPPANAPANPPKPPSNSGLPRGSGGPRTAPVSKKITLEQAKILRETNYKEYMRQVKAGNIEEMPE